MSLPSTRSVHLRSPFQWDPWHEIEELRRAFERIGGRSVGRVPPGTAGLGFVPETDLYDAGASFVVRADLPSVKERDLNITVEGSTLTIRGQREADGPRDERTCTASGRSGASRAQLSFPRASTLTTSRRP